MTLARPYRPFVFAVRPAFVAMFFLDGDDRKRVEYRTRRPSVDHGDTVLIYETAPMSKVVATAVVVLVLDGTPAEIWARTSAIGGIDRATFDAYFGDRPRAVAIAWDATRLETPLALPAGMAPPQAWARWKGPWPLSE